MDVAAFFTKWFADVDDSQSASGAIPAVVPNMEIVGEDGGPAWADAAVICPWTIYRCYGDKRVVERHFETMRRFVGFLEATQKDGIRAYDGIGWQGFGDWLSINAHTPPDLIGTAYLVYCANLLSSMAKEIGKPEEATHFALVAAKSKKAFQDRFVTGRGLVIPGSQTAYVLSLRFDLLQPEHRPAAVQALVDDIARRGWKLSTGFVGSSYLPHVLSDGGRLDVAFKLLHQKEWPSWLYAVTQGATTIWERWDGWTHDKGFQDVGMNSFNHYAYGAIGEWLYSKVAGIDLDPEVSGYKRFVLRPHPGGGLGQVDCSLHSVYGKIRSAWKQEGDAFTWNIEIPANTIARVYVPSVDGSVSGATVESFAEGRAYVTLGSGSYELKSKLPTA